MLCWWLIVQKFIHKHHSRRFEAGFTDLPARSCASSCQHVQGAARPLWGAAEWVSADTGGQRIQQNQRSTHVENITDYSSDYVHWIYSKKRTTELPVVLCTSLGSFSRDKELWLTSPPCTNLRGSFPEQVQQSDVALHHFRHLVCDHLGWGTAARRAGRHDGVKRSGVVASSESRSPFFSPVTPGHLNATNSPGDFPPRIWWSLRASK